MKWSLKQSCKMVHTEEGISTDEVVYNEET